MNTEKEINYCSLRKYNSHIKKSISSTEGWLFFWVGWGGGGVFSKVLTYDFKYIMSAQPSIPMSLSRK